jgi:hypothetical protein
MCFALTFVPVEISHVEAPGRPVRCRCAVVHYPNLRAQLIVQFL